MNLIPIVPVSLFDPRTGPVQATQFGLIGGLTVVLGLSASAPWALFDANKRVLQRGTGTLTAAQYAAWGTDDSWVTTCIMGNLGLVAAPAIPIAPVPTAP
jgi:hypothetical protein